MDINTLAKSIVDQATGEKPKIWSFVGAKQKNATEEAMAGGRCMDLERIRR